MAFLGLGAAFPDIDVCAGGPAERVLSSFARGQCPTEVTWVWWGRRGLIPDGSEEAQRADGMAPGFTAIQLWVQELARSS